jgi:hypothetical protein
MTMLVVQFLPLSDSRAGASQAILATASGTPDGATEYDQHKTTERAASADGNLELRVLAHLPNGTWEHET